jgi:hypothetical protein
MGKLHSPKLHHINTTNVTKQKHKICNSFTKSLQWNNFKFKFVKNTNATLLQNLYNGIISNLNLLKTHFFNNKNVNLFDDPWKTTTFIVLINELRNGIN